MRDTKNTKRREDRLLRAKKSVEGGREREKGKNRCILALIKFPAGRDYNTSILLKCFLGFLAEDGDDAIE